METSVVKTKEQVAQVQGFPDFDSAPKGDPTIQTIEKIENKLNLIYPESTNDERFMFHDHLNEMMTRAIEDPDYQEEVMRMIQFYG